MRKLRCLIVDDEPLAAKLLEAYVGKIERLELVGTYTSAADAMIVLDNEDIDIAFLDIQMPQISGMEIARSLADKHTAVIFVTAYREYAFEGFQVRAYDYLLKPVSFEEFNGAVGRVIERIDASEPDKSGGHLNVRSDYRLVRIDFADILYVEGLKDYVKIYVEAREKPVITLMSLKSIEQSLPESDFMRIHRSFIIAIKKVESFDRSTVQINGASIPVGDTYRTRFSERFE